jgi:undecaprenyl-diphosphatase
MSLLMALAERFCAHRRSLDHVSLKDAMLVGLAQVGALIPGVSRSGSTLTAAMFLDLKREEAARFSFLLGLPAIFLAGVKEFWELYKANLSLDGWMILGVGLLVASISAFVAIWSLMKYLERFSSWIFVVYRFLMGVVLITGVYLGWLT